MLIGYTSAQLTCAKGRATNTRCSTVLNLTSVLYRMEYVGLSQWPDACAWGHLAKLRPAGYQGVRPFANRKLAQALHIQRGQQAGTHGVAVHEP